MWARVGRRKSSLIATDSLRLDVSVWGRYKDYKEPVCCLNHDQIRSMIHSMHGLLLRLSQLPWPGVSAASFQAYAGVESSDEARRWHNTNPSVTESVSSLGELQSFSCFFLVVDGENQHVRWGDLDSFVCTHIITRNICNKFLAARGRIIYCAGGW